MSRYNLELGQRGEHLAEALLTEAGATVLARNYRFEPGEIDLLVEHEGDLVAVEVKTRSVVDLETPEEAVTRWKMRRIIQGLQQYAHENEMNERHWRIDVVAIVIDPEQGAIARITHIRDAYIG